MGSVVTEGLAPSFLVLLRPILPRFRPSGHKTSCRVRQGSSNLRWQGRFPQCRPDSAGGGGARHLGNRFGAAAGVLRSRWVRIFSITWGSSMQAMILTAPPQAGQVWMSMPNTRFRRCAQVMAAWRCGGVFSRPSAVDSGLLPLPRFAGVTRARCLLFGANTPWNRVYAHIGTMRRKRIDHEKSGDD